MSLIIPIMEKETNIKKGNRCKPVKVNRFPLIFQDHWWLAPSKSYPSPIDHRTREVDMSQFQMRKTCSYTEEEM